MRDRQSRLFNLMKIKSIAVALLSAIIAVGAFANGPKGGPTRLDSPLHLDSNYEKVVKGDNMVVACKTCDAMSIKSIESDAEALAYCEAGAEVSCPSCQKTARVERVARPAPASKSGGAKKFRYVNEHGEECMIISKVVVNK